MHIVGCFIINADLKVVDAWETIDLYSYYGLPRMSKASPKISCLYIYMKNNFSSPPISRSEVPLRTLYYAT